MAATQELEHRLARVEAMLAALMLADTGIDIREFYAILRARLPEAETTLLPSIAEILLQARGPAEPQRDALEHLQSSVTNLSDKTDSLLSEHLSFRERVHELESLSKHTTHHLSRTITSLERLRPQVEEYLVPISLGLPLDQVPVHRLAPVRIYLQRDELPAIERFSALAEATLKDLGFEVSSELPAERGSWFKRMTSRSKELLTHDEVKQRFSRLERAAEMEYLHTKQAEADRNHAEGIAALISALRDEDEAVCQFGSTLLIKLTDDRGKGRVVTRTLTQTELLALERDPSVLKSPGEIIRFLESSGRSLQAEPSGPGVIEV